MQPLSVVEDLDVFEYLFPGIVSAAIPPVMHKLSRERAEEAFHRSVASAVTLAAHAYQHPIVFEQLLVVFAGILAAAIRVMDQTFARPPAPTCHHERIHNQSL
jgi:hypothetical protein